MSKYDPLTAHLAGHAGPEWRASFAEIEEVLGFPLPKGARAGRIWWRNTGAQPHQRAWTGAGWEAADVDHAGGLITFRRKAWEEPEILKRLEVNPTLGMAIIAGSVALVAGLGALAIRGVMRRR